MAKQTKKTPSKAAPQAKAHTKAATPIYKAATVKRPSANPNMPQNQITNLTLAFGEIKSDLEEYAAHLRALDRKRLNGVGFKKQGFIKRAWELSEENPEFLPQYLTPKKFGDDYKYFNSFKVMFALAKQIQELLWNVTLQASDMVYTDALEFYASVREAAKRRVDASESLYKELELFFKRKKQSDEEGEPTEKKLIRDAKAVARGTKDGKVVIESVKPRLTGGVRKVTDETFKDTSRFKESEDAEFEE